MTNSQPSVAASETESWAEARVASVAPAALDGTTADAYSLLRRRGPWRDALRRRMLALADACAVIAAVAIAAGLGELSFNAVLLAPLWLVLAKLYGLYDNDHRALRHLTADELPTLLAWATTSAVLHVMLVSLVNSSLNIPAAGIRLWIAAIVITPMLRAAARALWRRVVPKEAAVLMGRGPLEFATRRKLELFTDIHVRCVGTIDDGLGGVDEARLVEEFGRCREAGTPVDRVIVASSTVDERMIATLVRLCRQSRIKLSVVPPARAMFGTAVQLRHIADLPLIEYSTWDASRSTMSLKRLLDFAVSTVLLMLLGPLMLLIALAVRVDSRGPALFIQGRAGLGGRPFRMYKFRTMTLNAHERLGEVVDLDQLSEPMFKLRNDPRVTRVGRVLRRTSLDELPQLVNVWLGQMSLVGPRPEELRVVARYRPEHSFRLNVKPGMTGPMQVYGRGHLRFDERLAVEREYIENFSLRRDIGILSLTLAAVVRGGGAF